MRVEDSDFNTGSKHDPANGRMRTVCFIVSAEITARTFYRGYLGYLHSAGWTVHLVAPSSGGLEAFARSENASAHALAMEREPSPLKDMIAQARLLFLLRRIRPTVVVTATPKAGLLGQVAAASTRVPVRVHQLWGLRYETVIGWRRKVYLCAEIVTARLSTVILANSRSLLKAAQRDSIIGRTPAAVLGSGSSHGVDLSYFSPNVVCDAVDSRTDAFLDRNPGRTVVGFVGRVNADKGLGVLRDAILICEAAGTLLSLLIVGEVEERRLYDELSESPFPVHFTGAVADVRPYMRVMEIHCLPSLREGFPNVVLEAAGLGIPTITTNATGAVDSVVDSVTGLICEAGSASSLAFSIGKLADEPDMVRQLGSNARAHAEAHFSQPLVWSQQENALMAQLLGLSSKRL